MKCASTSGLVRCKPKIIVGRCTINRTLDVAKVRRSGLTRTVALPPMSLIGGDLGIEVVKDRDVRASQSIDAIHMG